MRFGVVPPSQHESCYRYQITGPAFPVSAFLTYPIVDGDRGPRSILLVNQARASALLQSLTTEERRELAGLDDELRVWEARGRGALDSAKSVVNRLHARELNLPNAVVAVHKFGPVPAYVLKDPFQLVCNNVERTVRIAIYPSRRVSSKPTELLRGTSTHIEFLASLRVGLDLMFKRYLEDAAEHLFDIEHHSDLATALENGKRAEQVLAESIESKVAAILHPKKIGRDQQLLNSVARAIVMTYGDQIQVARYARWFALRLLRELYRSVGVHHKSAKYSREFRSVARERVKEPQLLWDDPSLAHRREAEVLRSAMREFEASSPGAASRIERLPNSGDELWLTKLVHFSAFVARLSAQTGIAGVPRLFLSRPHGNTTTEGIESLVQAHVRAGLGATAALIAPRPNSGDGNLRPELRTQIWRADSLAVLVPHSTLGAPSEWMPREVEHAFLLNKPVISMLENGSDPSHLAAQIATLKSPLSQDARRGADWLARVASQYEDLQATTFSWNPGDSLPESIRLRLDLELKRARLRQVTLLAQGILLQFDERARRSIMRLQLLARFPTSSRVLARQLFGGSDDAALARFRNLWGKIKEREVIVGERHIALLLQRGRDGRNYLYVAGLAEIFRALLPGLEESEVKDAFAGVYRWANEGFGDEDDSATLARPARLG